MRSDDARAHDQAMLALARDRAGVLALLEPLVDALLQPRRDVEQDRPRSGSGLEDEHGQHRRADFRALAHARLEASAGARGIRGGRSTARQAGKPLRPLHPQLGEWSRNRPRPGAQPDERALRSRVVAQAQAAPREELAHARIAVDQRLPLGEPDTGLAHRAAIEMAFGDRRDQGAADAPIATVGCRARPGRLELAAQDPLRRTRTVRDRGAARTPEPELPGAGPK